MLDELGADARLADYQPYWAALGALLARAGKARDADAAYARAIGLETDSALRLFLQQKRLALATGGTPPPQPSSDRHQS